jgi:HSP20 family protein
MTEKKQALASTRGGRDPFTLWRQMTSELDRVFEDWPALRLPSLARAAALGESGRWLPKIDVFEKDGRLVARADLPGMKKEDVSVEITDNQLVLSGERKRESEETQDTFYRREREYGRFYRAIPLPEGVKVEDVKATFADGVLEVSVPLPAQPEAKARKIQIEEPSKSAMSAA